MMSDDITSSISIAAVIMPSLDSKHLASETHHESGIKRSYQKSFVKHISCQMDHHKMVYFRAKRSQVPWTLTEKPAPPAYMPLKQRASRCHASEALPVGQTNRQPQKTKKILEPTRIEIVPKNL
jgi:hypothetical protein